MRRSPISGVIGLLALAALSAPGGGHGEEEGDIQTPYDVQVNVWRDEQPGDEARLHVSARFVPRRDAAAWSEVELAGLLLRAGQRPWQPETSALEPLADGGFEIRGQGAATVAAGTSVVPIVQLRTSAGLRELVLPESVVERVE